MPLFLRIDLGKLPACEVGVKAGRILLEEEGPAVLCAKLLRELVVAAHVRLRIGGRSRLRNGLRRRWRRHERHVLAAKRAVNEGLLPIAGVGQNLVADDAKGLAQIEAGRRQMFQQRRREGTVGAGTILRRRAALCGEGDQRVRLRRLDGSEAAPDGAGRHR